MASTQEMSFYWLTIINWWSGEFDLYQVLCNCALVLKLIKWFSRSNFNKKLANFFSSLDKYCLHYNVLSWDHFRHFCNEKQKKSLSFSLSPSLSLSLYIYIYIYIYKYIYFSISLSFRLSMSLASYFNLLIYEYIYIHTHTHTHIYIYIYIERERDMLHPKNLTTYIQNILHLKMSTNKMPERVYDWDVEGIVCMFFRFVYLLLSFLSFKRISASITVSNSEDV